MYKKQLILLVHPTPYIRTFLRHFIQNVLKESDPKFEVASSLIEITKGPYDFIVAHLNDVRPDSLDVGALRELRKEPKPWLGAFIGLSFKTADAHKIFGKEEKHPVIPYFSHPDQLRCAILAKQRISPTEQKEFWKRVFCDREYVKSQASLLKHEARKSHWDQVNSCIKNIEIYIGDNQSELLKNIRQYVDDKITDDKKWEALLNGLP